MHEMSSIVDPEMPSRVIQAGAGTGKTHRLVTLCLQLFAGGLAPARLCAVTFTEKAAAELKGRIRKRVDGLTEGAAEPDVPAREPLFWRAVRRDLGLAQVGTIHGLCAQILRPVKRPCWARWRAARRRRKGSAPRWGCARRASSARAS
jgi:ATP-dependent exoDNAse (exonuclease V) beta subunit